MNTGVSEMVKQLLHMMNTRYVTVVTIFFLFLFLKYLFLAVPGLGCGTLPLCDMQAQ